MSISDKLTRLSTARNNIITAITNKGVTATGHGFEDFPTDIAAITGGGGGTITITDTTDTAGGTIRTITTDANATVIEALSVTQSGTYTAPSGYAYSPVTVNVSGGGYTLLGSAEFTVNTTSSSAVSVGTISCGSTAWTSAKFLLVTVHDKAGARNGYFYSCAGLWYNFWAKNGTTSSVAFSPFRYLKVQSSGSFTQGDSVNGIAYGVYPASINPNGDIAINARYSSSASGTINGTYICQVWALDYPTGFNPWGE